MAADRRIRRHGDLPTVLLLGAAAILLVGGVTLPAVSVTRFFIFNDDVSILQAVAGLWRAGNPILAGVVAVFSILFPALKIAAAFAAWRAATTGDSRLAHRLHRIETLGKWSMLDVFVAALVLVSIKASAVADASVEPGLYLFLASILLSMLATHRLRRAAHGPPLNGGA